MKIKAETYLDKITNKAHHDEADRDSTADLDEFYGFISIFKRVG